MADRGHEEVEMEVQDQTDEEVELELEMDEADTFFSDDESEDEAETAGLVDGVQTKKTSNKEVDVRKLFEDAEEGGSCSCLQAFVCVALTIVVALVGGAVFTLVKSGQMAADPSSAADAVAKAAGISTATATSGGEGVALDVEDNHPAAPVVAQTTEDERFLEELAIRMKPRHWNISNEPRQFLHMHHMKTGGTSVDGLLRCALSRQKTSLSNTVQYGRVSECGGSAKSCVEKRLRNETDPCHVDTSSVMSYCASLKAVQDLGWIDADKFTILRHPLDRVWSMYRFTLTRCYKCQTLDSVFEGIANGTTTLKGTCLQQLLNHETDNMLTSSQRELNEDLTEEEIVAQAVENMRTRFTVVGLTDQLPNSIKMITTVFPSMAANLSEVSGGLVKDDKGCVLGHQNAGRPPSCGTQFISKELMETILAFNSRDLAVYKAAQKLFAQELVILNITTREEAENLTRHDPTKTASYLTPPDSPAAAKDEATPGIGHE